MPLYSREAAPETQRPEFAYAARSLNRTLVTTEGAMLEELLSRTAPAGQLQRAELARHLQLCHLILALTLTLALALILTLALAQHQARHLQQCHGEDDWLFKVRQQKVAAEEAVAEEEVTELGRSGGRGGGGGGGGGGEGSGDGGESSGGGGEDRGGVAGGGSCEDSEPAPAPAAAENFGCGK